MSSANVMSQRRNGMEWGVKANLAEPRSAMRTHALCWVMNPNPGWGGERVKVLARSRCGRLIETWIGTKRLTNLRAAWIPEHLRDSCAAWETKELAAEWAVVVGEAHGA